MGARQSKRSVDISGPPKKGELDNGGMEEGGKLERLEESDIAVAKTTQNGTGPHTASTPDTEEAAPVANGESGVTETTPEKAEETKSEEEKNDESLVNGTPESPEDKDKSTDDAAATSDKDKKKKEKSKKKWSFRSISFSRKDKSKPNLSKDDGKNGSITKEPVAEVVEAEAAAAIEAIPVKDDEPKKEDPTDRPEEEEKKKEEKTETSTEVQSPETTPASPAETPASPAPTPVEAPAAPVTPTPAPTSPAPAPAVEPVTVPATPPAPTPEPVAEPVVETTSAPVVEAIQESAPVVEAIQETIVEKVQEVPVVEEPVVEVKTEVKVEELPPPLPASPPPTEAPPPTPVATTPAPASQIPDVSLHAEAESQDNEVVGGGGESMAEPEDVDTEDKLEDTPLVNGIADHTHQLVEEISEKVEIVSENFKTIVTDSIISTQVTVTDKSEEKLEQTASAAE